VAGIIDNLYIHCKYGVKISQETGDWAPDNTLCKAIIKRCDRKVHESECLYAWASCIHKDRGCVFSGTKFQLQEHLKICHYERFKEYIGHNEEQIDQLKQQVRAQALEIDALKKKVDQMYKLVQQNQLEMARSPYDIKEDCTADLEARLQLQEARSRREQDTLIRETLSKERLTCEHTLTSHDDTVEALVVDQSNLYSASWDHTIKVWDTERLECKSTMTCNADVRELLLHNRKLYSGCGGGTIQVWDIDKQECAQTVRKHADDVLALKMAAGRLFSGSSDGTIKVWDIDSLECLDTFTGHSNWVFALAASDKLVFSGSSDYAIKVWSADRSTCVATLAGHNDQVRALAVANGTLFSGSYDCTIKMWDIKSMRCIQTFSVFNEIFGLDTAGNHLFSGDENGTIRIWDLSMQRCRHTLSDHTGSVYAFAVANGRLLSASSDTTIKVWH